MDEVIALLMMVFVFLAICTVLGHGIWLAVAWLLRQLAGNSSSSVPSPRAAAGPGESHCPHCQRWTPVGATRCRHCQRPIASASPASAGGGRLDELRLTLRHLHRLQREGSLTEAQLAPIISALQTELAPLLPPEPIVAELITEPTAPQPLAGGPAPKPATPPATAPGPQPAPSRVPQPAARQPRRPQPDAKPEPKPQPRPLAHPSAPPLTQPAAQPASQLVAQPAAPRAPRKPWKDLFAAFMEEKNIRWGELVAGILIVGSAVGLVTSLWSTVSSVRYFPALLFLLITAAIFGAGKYTLSRWKLRSTSRGLLAIALLLTPLNFLAAIAAGQNYQAFDPLYFLAVGIGLVCYGLIVWSSAKELLPTAKGRLFVAIMGTSAAQLVINRTAHADMPPWEIDLLALAPIACWLVPTIWELGLATLQSTLSPRRSARLLTLLGLASFALPLPVGLLVNRTGEIHGTLSELSPLLGIVALVVVGSGLAIHQRTAGPFPWLRTTGTALALFGTVLALATLALAWPDPRLLVEVGLVHFLALTALAVAARFPQLHVPALISLGLTWIVGWDLAMGAFTAGEAPVRPLLAMLISGQSAVALTLLAGAIITAAGLLRQRNRRQDALQYLYGGAVIAAGSLLVAVWVSLSPLAGWPQGDGYLATPVLLLDALLALLAAAKLQRQDLTVAGSLLLLGGLVHALLANAPVAAWLAAYGLVIASPLVFALLLHGVVVLLTAVAARVFAARDALHQAFTFPLGMTGIVGVALAFPISLAARPDQLWEHAGALGIAAGLWLVGALLYRRQELVVGGQALGSLGILLLGAAIAQQQDWLLLDPRHVLFQLAGLAGWSILWSVMRLASRPRRELHELLAGVRPGVDEVVLVTAVVAGAILLSAGVMQAVAKEPYVVKAASIRPRFVGALATGLFMLGSSALAVISWSVGIGRRRVLAGLVPVLLLAAGAMAGAIVPQLWIWGGWRNLQLDATVLWSSAGCGVVAALLTALVLCWLERAGTWPAAALVVGGTMVPLLAAGAGSMSQQGVAWLTWGLAAYAAAVVLARHGREPLTIGVMRLAGSLRWRVNPLALRKRLGTVDSEMLTALALAMAAMPVIGFTVSQALQGWYTGDSLPIVPRMLLVSGPLAVIAGTLALHAWRVGSSGCALAAVSVAQLAMNVCLALALWLPTSTFAQAELFGVVCWQANALMASASAILWLALRDARRRALAPAPVATPSPDALNVLLILASLISLAIPACGLAVLLIAPGGLPRIMASTGYPLGYLALAAAAVALGWRWRDHPAALTRMVNVVGLFGAAAGTLAAGSAMLMLPRGDIAYIPLYVTTGLWLALGTFLASVAIVSERAGAHWQAIPELRLWRGLEHDSAARRWLLVWGLGLPLFAVALASRVALVEPTQASPGVLFTLLALLPWAALAFIRRRTSFAYVATALLMLATLIGWRADWYAPGELASIEKFWILLAMELLTLIAAGFLWLLAQLYWQRQPEPDAARHAYQLPRLHHLAAVVPLATLALVVVQQLAMRGAGLPQLAWQLPAEWSWRIWLAATTTLVVTLWDRAARQTLAELYAGGLLAAVMFAGLAAAEGDSLLAAMVVAVAGYLLATVLAWQARHLILAQASALKIPEPAEGMAHIARWFPNCTQLLAALVAAAGMVGSFGFGSLELRLLVALATLLATAAQMLLAHRSESLSDRLVGLLLLMLTALQFGWAPLAMDGTMTVWLARAIRLLVVLATGAVVFGMPLARWQPVGRLWREAARRMATGLAIGAIAALGLVLAMEAAWPGTPPVNTLPLAAVAFVLVSLAVALVSLALLPDRDPFGWEGPQRGWYVYAAELVVALLFLHVYLVRPEWFGGIIAPWWPMVILGIAYLGIGISEVCRRRGLLVLSDPLERTGALLPVIPALGFSLFSSYVDYPLVLLMAGVLYAMLSVGRRSFVYSLLAALAGNGALWALMHRNDLSLLTNPQFWLVPPALCALVAAQLNRHRLGREQLAAVRYVALMLVYISSSCELFLQASGNSLWPPVVLATLAVAGVMAGIMLHVRAYLYAGTAFLLFAIMNMVSKAAAGLDHSWPWWAFGLTLGVAVLVLFGVFEKKRNEVNQLVGQLRQWEL